MESSRTIIPRIQSQGITSKAIADDVIKAVLEVVSSLNNQSEPVPEDILIYINATSGHVTCSGYWLTTESVHEASAIDLSLTIFWQFIDHNGYRPSDFDITVKRAVKRAFRKKELRKLLKHFDFYMEDELGLRRQIRLRNLLAT